MTADAVADVAMMASLIMLGLLFSLIGFNIAAEACDVTEGWVCGIADDGYHDGSFDWRHGVIPW